MASSPHPPGHELPPRDAAFPDSPATNGSSDPVQSIDRTSTSDSSFSAFGEVLSSTVGVAPKHLPRFGVGERNRADIVRDDPAGPAGPAGAPQEGETLHPAPPRPIPCEAFEINMDILREIVAEQRAAQPETHRMPPSSTTLPYLTAPGDPYGASSAADTRVPDANAHPERPASALSITSARSGVPGSSPHESPGVDAQVEAWSAGVADAAGPADEDPSDSAPPRREPATPLSKGVVEPLHGGFYLAEPSPPAAAGTPVSPSGERALPRLSHSEEAAEAQPSHISESTGEEGGAGPDGAKRVTLATRLRGEAKVLAGKLKNDDAKVAEGRALKSGDAL